MGEKEEGRPEAWVVRTVSGSGTSDHCDSSWPLCAHFHCPSSMALAHGEEALLVADTRNHVIRQVTLATGAVSTLGGCKGETGDADGCGEQARFHCPDGCAVYENELFVVDRHNHKVRAMNLQTRCVRTLVCEVHHSVEPKGFKYPTGCTVIGNQLFIADAGHHRICAIDLISEKMHVVCDGSSGPGLKYPHGIAPGDWKTSPPCALFICEQRAHWICRVTLATGRCEVFVGCGEAGFRDGEAQQAMFNAPQGLALSVDGRELLVADCGNHRIRAVTVHTGLVRTVAGCGKGGSVDAGVSTARIDTPADVIHTRRGEIVVASRMGHRIRLVSNRQQQHVLKVALLSMAVSLPEDVLEMLYTLKVI